MVADDTWAAAMLQVKQVLHANGLAFAIEAMA